MKKMMTAFAVSMIAGLVSAQIESANIVGYQTMTATAGFTAFTPTFTAVGSSNPTFGNIGGNFSFGDNLQFFSSDGNVSFVAVYDDGTINATPGWYDDTYSTSLADTQIPAGQAFFVSTASDVSMVVSGEVGASNIVVNCDVGFTAIGNPRPYNITYDNLQVANLSFGDNLQFFASDGNVSGVAVWDDGTINAVPGWYDDTYSISLATTEIPAGQGFFLSSANGGATCTIPALY